MIVLILILIISTVTILASLIKSFYTSAELERMGVFLKYPAAVEPPAELKPITDRRLPDRRLQPGR